MGLGMEIESIKVADLIMDPRNVNDHTEESIKAIMASLKEFGQQKPVVVDAGGVVRAGNGVVIAAMRLCWKQVQAVRTELEGADLELYAIADNRSSDFSKMNTARLLTVLKEAEVAKRAELAAAIDDGADIEEQLRRSIGAAGFTEAQRQELQASLNVFAPPSDPEDGLSTADDKTKPAEGGVMYSVVVPCSTQRSQEETYNALVAAGYKARKAST